MTDSREIEKAAIIKSMDLSRTGDLFLNLAKMAFSGIPGGGAIAALLDYGLKDMKEQRLKNFVAEVIPDLRELNVIINSDYVKTEDFAYLLEHTLRGVSQHYQKEKLDAYRALLVNSLIRLDVESERKEYFLNILNGLTTIHIVFLRVLIDPMKWASRKRIDVTQPATGNGPTALTNLRLLLPKYEETQIRSVMSDLYYDGLIKLLPSNLIDVVGPDLEPIINMLTPLGKNFLDFIMIESKAAS